MDDRESQFLLDWTDMLPRIATKGLHFHCETSSFRMWLRTESKKTGHLLSMRTFGDLEKTVVFCLYRVGGEKPFLPIPGSSKSIPLKLAPEKMEVPVLTKEQLDAIPGTTICWLERKSGKRYATAYVGRYGSPGYKSKSRQIGIHEDENFVANEMLRDLKCKSVLPYARQQDFNAALLNLFLRNQACVDILIGSLIQDPEVSDWVSAVEFTQAIKRLSDLRKVKHGDKTEEKKHSRNARRSDGLCSRRVS